VLTDKSFFGGSIEDLAAARRHFDGPILGKDFFIDPRQVVEARLAGADAVLVMLSLLDDAEAREIIAEAERFGMDALVEVHDEAEMARAGALGADLVGVNNRDLRTFTVDLAITERLAADAPEGALLVTESGLFTAADAARLERSGAKAMLVGESLMRQADVTAATRALLG
jgi:indole-3-glycerol phosphate synthase